MNTKPMRKGGRGLLLYGGIGVLMILAAFSVSGLRESWYMRVASEENLNHALLEQEYVTEWLSDVQSGSRKKGYDREDIGLAEEEGVSRIDVRGVEPLSGDRRVFLEGEVEFNIIEQ